MSEGATALQGEPLLPYITRGGHSKEHSHHIVLDHDSFNFAPGLERA